MTDPIPGTPIEATGKVYIEWGYRYRRYSADWTMVIPCRDYADAEQHCREFYAAFSRRPQIEAQILARTVATSAWVVESTQ